MPSLIAADAGVEAAIVSPVTNTVDTSHNFSVQVVDQFGNMAVFDNYDLLLRIQSASGNATHTVAITSGAGFYVFSTTAPQMIALQLVHSVSSPSSVSLPSSTLMFTIQPGKFTVNRLSCSLDVPFALASYNAHAR